MKKSLFFIMIIALVAVGSGCGNTDAADRDTGRYEDDAMDDKDDDSGEIGDKDGIYLFSYECGYFSWDQKPDWEPLLIENSEQLEFAKERYGLDYPDDYNEEDYWYYDSSFIEYFREMESNYPLEEYSYLIQYNEVSSGGYYLHADRVIIDGNTICFGMDDTSCDPAEGEAVPEVMGGFMHMAAIPKEYTEGTVFDNVVYPDKDDLEQCLDFSRFVVFDIAGAELMEAYGREPILIETEEDCAAFLENGKDITLNGGKTLEQYVDVDFDNLSVYIIFFTRDDDTTFITFKDYEIVNGVFTADFELDTDNPGEKREETTGMIGYYIPKRFLQGEVGQDGNGAQEAEIPDDYIAVFHGGDGELTHETYIYKIDNGASNTGFRYINTESRGMTADDWQQIITETGEVTWTDDVFTVAENNDAYSYVTLPNDSTVYTISDFRDMFLMN